MSQMSLGGMPSLWKWRGEETIKLIPGGSAHVRNTLVTTSEDLQRMVRMLCDSPHISHDTETSGLNPHLGARAIGHAFATVAAGRKHIYDAFYAPIRHINDPSVTQLSPEHVSAAVADVYRSPGRMSMHHAKFDLSMVRADGIVQVVREVRDVSVRAVIHNENEQSFGLKQLAKKYITEDAQDGEKVIDDWMRKDARALGVPFKKRKKGQEFIIGPVTYYERYGHARVPIVLEGIYACRDALYTLIIDPLQEPEVSKYPMLWARECGISDALLDMEWNGLPADPEAIRNAQERADEERLYWLGEIRRFVGSATFEPTADALRDLFYKHWAMEVPKQTSGDDDSVDKEARGLLAAKYPSHAAALKTIDAYAKIEKISGTYGAAFLRYYSHTTGCIHPSYNQLEQREEGGVPVTGRLASSNPNAQNVAKKPIHLRTCGCDECVRDWNAGKLVGPIRSPGPEDTLSIRRYFTVPHGYARIFIDLSQIELRVLAWYSRDPSLLEAYANDLDIHAMTAEDVTGGDRDIAKQVNFGNSYGMTEIGLAKRMKGYYADPEGTRAKAKVVLARFFAKYHGIPRFRNALSEHMRRNGNLFVSALGRPRRIVEIGSHERWVRERGERMMMSSAISGTAADMNKEIMLRNRRYLRERFGTSDPRIGLKQTVHDEVMYDVPIQGIEETIRGLMHYTKWWPMFADGGVPIDAGCSVSVTTWEGAKKVKIGRDGSVSLAA